MDSFGNVFQGAYSSSSSNEYRVCKALVLSQYLYCDQHMWMGLSMYGARSVVIDQSQKELHISRCRQRGQHSQDSLLIHPIHYQTQGNDELDMFAWKKAISLFSHHRYSELITNEQKTQLRALVLAIYSKAYNNASPPQFQTFLNHLCDFPKTLGFQQNNLNLVQSSIVSASESTSTKLEGCTPKMDIFLEVRSSPKLASIEPRVFWFGHSTKLLLLGL